MKRLSVPAVFFILIVVLVYILTNRPADGVWKENALNKSVHNKAEAVSKKRDFKKTNPCSDSNINPYSWVSCNKIIAHGMGGLNGKGVTNSLEAFQYNYKKGSRVFEIDLVFTNDNHLVARHSWGEYMYAFLGQKNQGETLSLEEFKNLKIHGSWTPLSVYDVIDLMKKYPDIYIVLDTKYDLKKVVKELVTQFTKEDPSLLKRVIPQIYGPEDFNRIKQIYHFNNVIFTLYKSGMSDEEILEYVKVNRIKVVTMYEERVNQSFVYKLVNQGVFVYVNTINDKEKAKCYLNMGASGVYSDFLVPSDLQ